MILKYLTSLIAPPCQFIDPAPYTPPKTQVKLSAAMRLGIAVTRENGYYYLCGKEACALGAAVLGAGWEDDSWTPLSERGQAFMVERFGLSYFDLVNLYVKKYRRSFESDLRHRRITRKEIADNFERIGL